MHLLAFLIAHPYAPKTLFVMQLTFFGPQPCLDYCDNAEALRRNPSLTHLNQSPGLADSLLLIREALTSTIAHITLLSSSDACINRCNNRKRRTLFMLSRYPVNNHIGE
jgi:hypothetical protein|tara:strand:+ start:60 stop:386 length:327 start_codon:yes stop_codon:yes gene_type:complete